MNIVEALKLSKHLEIDGNQYYFDRDVYGLDTNLLLADNWKPVLPEKKFYQAVLCLPGEKESNYYIVERLFESPEKAESYAKDHDFKLVRFLSENPIEVEV